MEEFKTHDGRIIKGVKLKNALKTIADDYRKLAYNIYIDDNYADHITDPQKFRILEDRLKHALLVEDGMCHTFTTYQRLNELFTNECIGFLGSNDENIQ